MRLQPQKPCAKVCAKNTKRTQKSPKNKISFRFDKIKKWGKIQSHQNEKFTIKGQAIINRSL